MCVWGVGVGECVCVWVSVCVCARACVHTCHSAMIDKLSNSASRVHLLLGY